MQVFRQQAMHCGSKVSFFIENLTIFLLIKKGHKYSHTNSYIFAMTLITQDDHLTAGVWAACGCHCDIRHLKYTAKQQKRFEGCSPCTKQNQNPEFLHAQHSATKSHMPPPGKIVVPPRRHFTLVMKQESK